MGGNNVFVVDQQEMTPYERWLLRKRVYCEWKMCMKRSVHVCKIDGHDFVFCDEHKVDNNEKEREKARRKHEQK